MTLLHMRFYFRESGHDKSEVDLNSQTIKR